MLAENIIPFLSEENENQPIEIGIDNNIESLQRFAKVNKIIAVSLLMTGLFAAIGALYRWGDGSLFSAPPGLNLQLYIADLLIAAPFSIIASIGLQKQKRWGVLLAIVSSGIFIYGSAQVYINVIQAGFPYPLKLIIPPIFGLTLSISIILWTWKNLEYYS